MRCILLSLLGLMVLGAPLGRAQLQFINMDTTVNRLAERFRELANKGLGLDVLKETYSRAEYTFSSLNDTQIGQMLNDPILVDSVNEVLTLFSDIESDAVSSNPVTPTDCCTTGASDSVCCFPSSNCSSSPAIQSIAGAYMNLNIVEGSILQFGSPDGSLLMRPARSLPANDDSCEVLDARLQTWFSRVVKERPLEVVIILDVFNNPGSSLQLNDVLISGLRSGAIAVMRSLTEGDRVGIVGVDVQGRLPPSLSLVSNPKTQPVCPESVLELESFVSSFTVSDDTMINTATAFEDALSLFSDGIETEKILLYFSPGYSTSSLGRDVSLLNNTINAGLAMIRGDVSISVVRAINDQSPVYGRDIRRNDGQLVTLSQDLMTIQTPVASQVAGYYTVAGTSSNETMLRHERVLANSFLSITRTYINNSSLVGVFHVLLPWKQLLMPILPNLSERPLSYAFVVDTSRRVLYHPLDEVGDGLPITFFETENIINAVLDEVDSNNGGLTTSSVVKRHLLHTGEGDENGFVPLTAPSTYHCRRVTFNNNATVYVCVVLADEERQIATLSPVSTSGLYSSDDVIPIYHNLNFSMAQTCNYYCKPALINRVSFQLTDRSLPTSNDSQAFVNAITDYVSGQVPTPPAGVQSGVATEIALASSVTTAWIDTNSDPSEYIIRRHLATPTGAYLTYPAVQIRRDFVPMRTQWYQAPLGRENLLTLTPPHNDPLREGNENVVSVAYAVRAPTTSVPADVANTITDGLRPLAVVAADIPESIINLFIRDTVPMCTGNPEVSCFIINELGNLVNEARISNSSFLGSNSMYRSILFNLLRRNDANFLTKMQCGDSINVNIKTRRFYHFNTSSAMSLSDTTSCTEYKIQQIPGTNTFFVILRRKCQESFICFCSDDCNNCDSFPMQGCECPCRCRDDCKDVATSIQPCPASEFRDANYAAATTPISTLSSPFCFNQECNCRSSEESCAMARECNWCSNENKCIHVTDCCTRGEECCSMEPQLSRFIKETSCFSEFTNICRISEGTFDADCPGTNNTSVIVAVVVGCIFGILLIIAFVLFIIWYQLCRRSDPAEETSRESAFDFSNKRIDSTNPMAVKKGKTTNGQFEPDNENEKRNASPPQANSDDVVKKDESAI